MTEERQLSKTEATLGLSLIAVLLMGLGAAYVHQLDKPPAAPARDASLASSQPTLRERPVVEQTAYRPTWLDSSTNDAAARATFDQ